MREAPRGSAEQINQILIDSLKRMKVMADELAKTIARSGYPPLTLPMTLQDLKAMPRDKAEEYLISEIKRTMVKDPVTGDMKANLKTIELALDYKESLNG
jgi:hypothetical protein